MEENIEKYYHKPERYFVINNGDGIEQDRDLIPIYISLPHPPKLNKIKNYGLHPDQQVYKRDVIPEKLINLEERARDNVRKAYEKNRRLTPTGYKILREYWSILEEEKDYYQNEIKFIKNVIWKTIHGEWAYIDGTPRYLPGWFYEYLNFWYMPYADGLKPSYWEVDRLSYLFYWYLFNAHETFANLDSRGFALKKNGIYEMKDTGGRIFYGVNEPKNRRNGGSHRAIECIFAHMRKVVGKNATMISKSGKDVEIHYYRRMIPAWQKYPMFLKPAWDGNNNPAQLNFEVPSNEYFYKGINSKIDYIDTTGEVSMDSQEIEMALFDEQGKPTGGGRVDVFERWEVSKQTMSKGNGAVITGFCFSPTSVEYLDEGGGRYKMMCDQSNFYQRLPNGQTKSGLALMFFPAQMRLEGFFDHWGKSVVGKPTVRQKRFGDSKFKVLDCGSKQYLEDTRNQLLASGNEEDKKSFRSLRRKHPMNYGEIWLSSAGGMGFDIEIIDKRLIELERLRKGRKSPIKRGYFKWLNDKKDTFVKWETDPEGRFELAMDLPLKSTNNKRKIIWNDVATGKITSAWEPIDYYFMTGADPFGYGGKKEKMSSPISRQSDGGIATLWMHDPKLDPGDDMREWKSDLFVLSYRYRPASQEEYNEDVLMACVYFGSLLYLERNITDLWKYFINRGYAGYLAYNIDPITGKKADKPGAYASAPLKNAMFAATKDYIRYRGHKELFASYLEEIKLLRKPEDMTRLDRFTAHGWALMGAKSLYPQRKQSENSNILNLGKSKIFGKYL